VEVDEHVIASRRNNNAATSIFSTPLPNIPKADLAESAIEQSPTLGDLIDY
jgi:hypothetical protein